MRIDLGDVVAHINLEVPGLRRHHFRWHVGPALDTTPADRTSPTPGTPRPTPRKVDLIMDLQADKKVALSLEWTDEVGNPTTTPPGATVTFTVDNTAVIALTDNGDGTASAAATGTLGAANVHVEATAAGLTVAGDLALVVVAGLAERVNVVPGEPEEVTPDDLP